MKLNTYVTYKELFVGNNGKHQLTLHCTEKLFLNFLYTLFACFSIYYFHVLQIDKLQTTMNIMTCQETLTHPVVVIVNVVVVIVVVAVLAVVVMWK